ncbi:unnamed protein product [Rhizoctonia solani]|uniref:Uncharacterized protein n=1 Tax=Rhizoctonia solani TaxID=456999 RepID=A0A8H3H7H7_9AGAM|nr:unnamed protein product [Rhizoctonia solani]
MSRVMRSGRTYDPGQAPAAPKRCRPRLVSTMGTMTSEIQETLEGSLVLNGTGKRKGETTKRTADRALGVSTTPDAANCATSAPRVPETPDKHESALGMSVGYSGQPIYITARTSRTYRTESGDKESTHEKLQYVRVDNSPSHAYKYSKGCSEANSESNRKSEPAGISGFEEMRKAKNLLEDEELPELDADWYRDHWSWSQHLLAPDTKSGNQLDDTGSVSVNALIYEVSKNDMLTDEEYERLLETLCNQERLRSAREYKPSQTSGAGPSGACRIPPVTLEEVEDEGEGVHVVVSSGEERESEYKPAPKGKGKGKGRIGKTRPCTSLGVIIDEVQRDPDISYTERIMSQSLRESQPADRIPEGFSSGGYAQAMYRTGARDQSLVEVCCLRRVKHIAAIDKPQSEPPRPTPGLELRSKQSEPRHASQRDGGSRNIQNHDPSKSRRYSRRDERPNLAGTPSDSNDDQSESSSSGSLDSESSNDEDEPWGNPNRQIMKLLAV